MFIANLLPSVTVEIDRYLMGICGFRFGPLCSVSSPVTCQISSHSPPHCICLLSSCSKSNTTSQRGYKWL